MHGHIKALDEEEAQSYGLLRSAGLALEAPAGLASDGNQQQSAAEGSSEQQVTYAEPQPGAGDQPQEAAKQAAGQQEAAAAQSLQPADDGLAAAAAGHPASGAGETAGELQPQSAADQAAAQQLMREEVSRGGAALQGYLSGSGRLHSCVHVVPEVTRAVVLCDRLPRRPSRHSCRWQRSSARGRRQGQSPPLQLLMSWWPCHRTLRRCAPGPVAVTALWALYASAK